MMIRIWTRSKRSLAGRRPCPTSSCRRRRVTRGAAGSRTRSRNRQCTLIHRPSTSISTVNPAHWSTRIPSTRLRRRCARTATLISRGREASLAQRSTSSRTTSSAAKLTSKATGIRRRRRACPCYDWPSSTRNERTTGSSLRLNRNTFGRRRP